MICGFLSKLNLAKQCREDFNVSVWRCPTFLFILMGVVVMISILTAYFISNKYGQEPEMTALLVLFTTAITFTIGHIIVRSFSLVVEANHLKSQFLNIASHQLLTPLTALKWSVNALDNKTIASDTGKQKEMLGILQENNNKMINLVNGLLDISRMENGKVHMSPEKFDIVRIVKDLVSLKENELAKKQNKVEFSTENDSFWVMADPARTKMAVEHLIDNAIQYSRYSESIFLNIKEKDGRVIFEIRDKGIGIPAKERKQVFGKFFLARNALSAQRKGLGLGLFLAKFIIEASGGEINFESEEGVGSRFWFSLPAVN